MTPQEIITEARYIISDTNSVGAGYRQSDTELLGYVNESIREAAVLQPTYFASIGDLICTVGQCEQGATFPDAAALLEVLCIHGGDALTPFDMESMNSFNPGWRSDTAGAARQWSRFTNDPLKFFIYPKAPSTQQVLDVRYIRIPASFTISQTITELPDVMRPALVDYVAYRAESKNDESVSAGRALAFYQSFVSLVKG